MAAQSYTESKIMNNHSISSRIVAAIVALAMAFLLVVGSMAVTSTKAYGAIYPVDQTEAAETYDASDAGDNAIATADDATEGEQIADDEVPMASGLGGAEVMSTTAGGFQWAIIAGIVAVVAFFAASMFRTNQSISKMRDMMK